MFLVVYIDMYYLELKKSHTLLLQITYLIGLFDFVYHKWRKLLGTPKVL